LKLVRTTVSMSCRAGAYAQELILKMLLSTDFIRCRVVSICVLCHMHRYDCESDC
jgi:hypothetical protein